MKKTLILSSLIFIFFCFLNLESQARSSLGIGVAEQPILGGGTWGQHIAITIGLWQNKFERLITDWFIHIRQTPSNIFKLFAVSFIYGIIHALGPGHGKAVISSYLFANNESFKRGIALSFCASLLQAISAIFIVALVYYLLPARLTQASEWAVRASFGLIMLLGLSLLWRKSRALYHRLQINHHPHDSVKNNDYRSNQLCEPVTPPPLALNLKSTKNSRADTLKTQYCEVCTNAHILSADLIEKPLTSGAALSAIISVGIRPCTGAIFIITFTLINGLFLIGSLAVFIMALGTFITVASLATLAVKVKDLAHLLIKRRPFATTMFSFIEWVIALGIFVIGFLFMLQ
ncbi:nickel/cobalt transporter [Bartonella sp. DGB2]|uniref:nickel/cobalt transporter n=1 Tax=Bartonella sp. DGB2 TaxID=3388426 RepID=UPI0039901463